MKLRNKRLTGNNNPSTRKHPFTTKNIHEIAARVARSSRRQKMHILPARIAAARRLVRGKYGHSHSTCWSRIATQTPWSKVKSRKTTVYRT